MSEFFDYDPDRGITTYFDHDELTEKTTLRRVQDLDPLLDYCKALRNDGLRDDGIKNNFWHYCYIPATVEHELLKKGISIHDPSMTKRVVREINENYPYLKTTEKKHAG